MQELSTCLSLGLDWTQWTVLEKNEKEDEEEGGNEGEVKKWEKKQTYRFEEPPKLMGSSLLFYCLEAHFFSPKPSDIISQDYELKVREIFPLVFSWPLWSTETHNDNNNRNEHTTGVCSSGVDQIIVFGEQ